MSPFGIIITTIHGSAKKTSNAIEVFDSVVLKDHSSDGFFVFTSLRKRKETRTYARRHGEIKSLLLMQDQPVSVSLKYVRNNHSVRSH